MTKIIPVIPEKIQHSFCAAKWLMVTMHFGMAENHSCYHPPIHRWDLEKILADPGKLHNTDHKIKQRQLMMNGERPEECYYCFNMEDIDSTVFSDRRRFSTEPWALERLEEIVKSNHTDPINPSYLEISFANTCNFACSYCSPGQSSRWENEIMKYGSYPVVDKTVHRDKMHNMIPEDNNPYIEAFWKWLPTTYSNLRYLRITGGEPLATRNFMKLLDFVATNNNPDLTLVINTNLCVPDKNLNMFFEKATTLLEAKTIKGLEVYTSMDTWGDHAEYIRDGLSIDRWEKTVRQVHDKFKVPIRIMVTFGLLSVFKFDEFVKKVIEFRQSGIDIMFNCARLTDPKHFDLRILPDHCDQYFERVNNLMHTADNIMSVERETWEMVYRYWKTRYSTLNEKETNWRRSEFSKFTAEYDHRRGKNFSEIFLELSEWI